MPYFARKATALKYALHDLFISERTDEHTLTSKPRPGIDGDAVLRGIGCLAMLDFGFDRVRLKKPPPYPVGFDDAGQRKVVVEQEFVTQASKVIRSGET